MNSIDKRKELFRIYSEEFRIISQSSSLNFQHPLYICPLCLQIFDENALEQTSKNPLTIEHVPPKNCGGKDLVLTCKKCNNNDGANFDSQLKTMNEAKKILSFTENAELRTSIMLNGKARIGSKFKFFKNNKFGLIMDPNKTNPKHLDSIHDFINHKYKAWEFEFKIQMPNMDKAGISLLRSAYLLMFKKIGYRYIMNSEIIRRWIWNYDSNPKPFNGIYCMGNEDNYLGINKIDEPDWLKGRFLVVIKYKTDIENTNYGLLLPGNKNERIDYENLKPKIGKITFSTFE